MNKIAMLVSSCILLFASACKTAKHKDTEAAGKFTVTNPIKVDTSFTKEYVSQIQSIRNIEIRAQEKGYLQDVYVDEGQHVSAGQLLFRIMPKMYQAEYLKAEAEARAAELEMINTKTLADKNIVSKAEFAIAEAKYNEAKADVALARLHLQFTEIRAPFEGTIDRLRFKLGSLIDEGTLLTSLSDNKQVYAYFNVSESEYLDFKTHSGLNQKNGIRLLLANGQQHRYPGTIETIESEFDSETGNIAFRAKFPNPDLLLKHGETGKVQMTVPLSNALIIPQKATYELQDKIYVFVVDKNNVVRSRNISIKSKLPDLYVVDGGINVNERILLEGVQNVKDDDRIQYTYTDPKNVIANLQLIKE